MKKLSLLCILLLTACQTSAPTPTTTSSASSISPVQSSSVQTLEQLPSTLSIEHFSTMRLEGTDLELGTVLDDNSAYTRYQISYKSNGLTISGIMNIPKGPGPFPLLILNHGYIDPAVYTVGRGLKREQDYLAREGFAVLHTDYRGHGNSDPSPDTREVYDAALEYSMDSINAINAVRNANLPTVDASKVGMLGHSMGGGITLNVAVAHPQMIDAIALYAPVHADAWENFMRWHDLRDEEDRTQAELGTRQSNPDRWDALSSQTYLDQIDDPIILFHGTNDGDVPIEWSEDLVTNLETAGKGVNYVRYPGERHEFGTQWQDFMRQTASFMREHLVAPTTTVIDLYDESRVTKKDFGQYIDAANSPIANDRFTGYHTGIDFEAFENEDETQLQVTALCDGTVLRADWVSGYGGVLVQSCTHNGEPITVLYGHMNPLGFAVQTGTQVTQGDVLGVLGEGFTQATDRERPHLHLSVHKGVSVELKGYVSTEQELEAWLDPRIVLP